jgi:3-isopropylmalate dehydrogenase
MVRVLILPGDGIGGEIMPQVRRIVEWFVAARGLRVDLRERLFGIPAWKAHGTLMPDETWSEIVAADAILFGAIGSHEYPSLIPADKRQDQALRMRRDLDLFINLRPMRVLPALAEISPVRSDISEGTDLLIVREFAGGVYFGTPRGIEALADGTRRAVNTVVYTDTEIRRIARAAFDIARARTRKVTSVDKANVLETGRLWREVVQQLRDAEYPDVELSHMYVDNCAMQLVRAPRQFDVILTENQFGDILSDAAAAVAGSIGLIPSASFGAGNEDGSRKAIYEAIHGSAPDIAGRGIANPIGSILSFALCLRYSFGLPDEAKRLEAAVESAIRLGHRTPDIASASSRTCSTVMMTDAVINELDRSCR